MTAPRRMVCGNDPTAQLTDSDRAAIDEFDAFLKARAADQTPRRVQRTRTKDRPGIPAGAVYVGRPTPWGNPWRIGQHYRLPGQPTVHVRDQEQATGLYRQTLATMPALVAKARRELAGRDLACWCRLPEPGEPDHCHAAVLLDVARGEEP